MIMLFHLHAVLAHEFQVVSITTVDRREKVTEVIWCLHRDKLLQALSCNLVNSIWYRLRFVP